MRLIRSVLFPAVAALAAMTVPAAARPLTEAEAKSLNRAVESYMGATRNNDAEALVRSIPPRILNVFAGTAGIEAKSLQSTLVKQTEALTKGLKVRNTHADTGAADGQDGTLADGTAISWVVVPTTFEAEKDGKKTHSSQALVALNEGGKWFFVRMDGPQQKQIAVIAYPFLSAAVIPDAVVAPMN